MSGDPTPHGGARLTLSDYCTRNDMLFGAADQGGRDRSPGDRVECCVASPFHVTQLSGGRKLFPAGVR